MRRMLVAVTVVMAWGGGLVATPTAVSAVPLPADHTVTVPFAGTSTFDFSTPACPFAHQVFDAGIGARARLGTLHADGCVDPVAGFPYHGTFVITTPHLGEVEGTVSGSIATPTSDSCPAGLVPGRLTFTLTPTHGTKAFRHDTTPISLAGIWCSPAVPDVAGTIAGTLTGAVPRHQA